MTSPDCWSKDLLRLRDRPTGRPAMFQSWKNLLFLHWQIPPELGQSWLPPGLTIDTFEGSAWVGVVLFLMRNIRPAGLPAVPWISNFLELNVRTYARDENGTPGVWFLSLDANRWLAVQWARLRFSLPYFQSVMEHRMSLAGETVYRCRRKNQPGECDAVYEWSCANELRLAEPGTLEFFLIERYLLFALTRNRRLATGRVYHPPYPLQSVQLLRWSEQPLTENRILPLQRPPDHAVASPGVDVEVFGLQPQLLLS